MNGRKHSRRDGDPQALPAKLLRPRIARAYPRQRLLQQLEETLTHAAVWISAGPGSGKTVLASTYVENCERPCAWYRLDSRDRDPATLFHYLRRIALAASPHQAQVLPHLTLEYLAGIETYARNFFEHFFECLAADTILVFDNCQELDRDCITALLLAAGLERAPPNVNIILTSRVAPSAPFARLLASERLRVIDGASLELDNDEASDIARMRFAQHLSAERVADICRRTRGWVAGFILLLEQTCTQEQQPITPGEHLFDYFASEVLSDIAPEVLDTLLQSAWWPRIPARLLGRQCQNEQAPEQVAALCRRNYFISESGVDETVYEYHPLFRDCLLRYARERWPAARLDDVRRRTVALMIAEDQHDEALDVLLELGDWQQVATLIETHAPVWLALGRAQIVESVLVAMPAKDVVERPWLLFWKATCRLPFDLAQARELFAQSERRFRAADDCVGQLLACAAVLESYFHERGDFHPLDEWIDKVEDLLAQNPQALANPNVEARVTAAMFSALMARQPGNPNFRRWITRAEKLVMHTHDELLRLSLATHLVAYYAWWSGDSVRAGAMVDAIEPGRRGARNNPLNHIVWSAAAAINRWSSLNFDGCIEIAQRGLQIAAASGIHLWDFLLLARCSWGAIFTGNETEAEAFLQRMAGALQPGHYLDASHYHFQRFILAMSNADAAAMTVQADATWKYAHSAGDPWAEGLGLVARARASAVNGARDTAQLLLREAESQVGSEAGNTIVYAVLLARAELAFDATDPGAGIGELRELMQFACRNNIVYSNWERDAVMADLCVPALEQVIQPDFVCRLIHLRHLVPRTPPLHLDNWPWPLDIDTLGHFEVRVDGTPLHFDGKSQKRPLALLKVLVAMGGQNVPETRVVDALWPEGEGDAAQQSLATTLHRLRQLIATETVHRQEGVLSLDPAWCRVDLWTCERYLDRIEGALPDDATAAHVALLCALALYRGPFLDGDADAAWAPGNP